MKIDPSPLPGFTSEQISKARAPLDSAYTLPRAAYVDPEIAAIENERVLRRSWLPVARLEQVPNAGDYQCFDLLGQPLMLVHGHDGVLRVMSRVCLHRSAPIAEGAGNKRLFVCPYHAWSYTSDGCLKRAPLMDDAVGFQESDCRLPQLRTEIWNGFVFVNFDHNAADLGKQIAGFEDFFAPFRLEQMRIIDTIEFESEWNWKVLVENFMEAYHHIAIHARSLEPQFHARDSKILDDGGIWSILHMPAARKLAHEGFPLIDGLEEWQESDLFAAVVFPYLLIAVQGDSMIWYQVTPLGHDRLTLRIRICVPESSIAVEQFDQIKNGAAALVKAVHHEDIEANDLVWRGLNAPLTKQGRLSPLEKTIWHMNQWWLARMLDETGVCSTPPNRGN